MEVVTEYGEFTNYRSIVDNEKYEAIFNRRNMLLILKIDSNILSNNNFVILFGKVYKDAVSNIPNCKDVEFEFCPSDEIELRNANNIINDYKIGNKSVVNASYKRENRGIEDYFKAYMITKYDNGMVINYIERKADVNNNGYILENVNIDDMKDELNKIIDENEIDLDSLTDTEVACLVIDRIAENRRQYFLDSADSYVARDERQQATLNATNKDDKVNTEIGIIKKDPYDNNSFNSYRAVEHDGENYRVVNPAVNEVSSVNGLDTNNSGIDLNSSEIENRQEENIYYVDNYTSDIYVQFGADVRKIGNLNDGNYRINFDNNNLVLNDIDLGPIDDINNMGKSNDLNKPKVKTLEKNNTGNISLAVMCLIVAIVIFICLGIYVFFW